MYNYFTPSGKQKARSGHSRNGPGIPMGKTPGMQPRPKREHSGTSPSSANRKRPPGPWPESVVSSVPCSQTYTNILPLLCVSLAPSIARRGAFVNPSFFSQNHLYREIKFKYLSFLIPFSDETQKHQKKSNSRGNPSHIVI